MYRLCLVFFFASQVLRATDVPRGVHPANIAFYNPLQNFTCLDKSATIPWMKVNDDYCDCMDGSDEPGTSACPGMKFYCPNIGHKAEVINSTFVNDMVCDCCDGSDEYLGHIKCENTCLTIAKKTAMLYEHTRKDIEIGHEIYKTYVTKKAVELQEQALRDSEEAARLAQEETVEPHQQTPEVDDPKVEVDVQPVVHSQEPETETSPEASVHQAVEDEAVEQEKEVSDAELGEKEPAGEVDHSDETPSFEESPVEDKRQHDSPVKEKPIDYGPDNGFLMLTKQEAGCLEVRVKEYVYSLCGFEEARQRNQHDSPGSGTVLGYWDRWVGHPDDSINWSKEDKLANLPYNEMLYTNGHHCWNGPSRSVKVKVSCGSENRLLSAEEPSRCTYLFKLKTPAACHHDPAYLLQMHTEL